MLAVAPAEMKWHLTKVKKNQECELRFGGVWNEVRVVSQINDGMTTLFNHLDLTRIDIEKFDVLLPRTKVGCYLQQYNQPLFITTLL